MKIGTYDIDGTEDGNTTPWSTPDNTIVQDNTRANVARKNMEFYTEGGEEDLIITKNNFGETVVKGAASGKIYQTEPSSGAMERPPIDPIDILTGAAAAKAVMGVKFLPALVDEVTMGGGSLVKGGINKIQSLRNVSRGAESINFDDVLMALNDRLHPIKLNNSNAEETLAALAERLGTKEGIKRAKDLGLSDVEIERLRNLKLYKNSKFNNARYDNDVFIGGGVEDNNISFVTRHEVEHGVQTSKARSGFMEANEKNIILDRNMSLTDIDKDLKKLELIENPAGESMVRSSSRFEDLLNNEESAIKYFKTGSRGKEKSPFLAELQEEFRRTGRDVYEQFSASDIENARSLFAGRPLRILNISKNTAFNNELLARNLNKMISGAGLATFGEEVIRSGIGEETINPAYNNMN